MTTPTLIVVALLRSSAVEMLAMSAMPFVSSAVLVRYSRCTQRNHSRNSGASLGNFGVSLRHGLFLGSGLNRGDLPDPGFIANAKEFYTVLEGKFPVCDTAKWPLPGAQARAPEQMTFMQAQEGMSSRASLDVANTSLENDGYVVRMIAKGDGGVVFTSPTILTVLPPDRS